MPKGITRTLEEKRKLVNMVLEQYVEGNTLESSCDAVEGISVRSFYMMCDEFAEFADAYKKAQAIENKLYLDRLRKKAKTSLQKRVEGCEYDVKEFKKGIVGGKETDVEVEKKVVVQPSDTAIIFALKATDPETFGDKATRQDEVMEVLNDLVKRIGSTETKPVYTIQPDEEATVIPSTDNEMIKYMIERGELDLKDLSE